MLHTLTDKDITPEAIQRQLESQRECEKHLAKLKEQRQVLQEQIEMGENLLTVIKHDVQWRQLMAEIEEIKSEEFLSSGGSGKFSSSISRLSTAFEDAVQKFRNSLIQPEDYPTNGGDESVIPYSDTDDYADFTVVEDVIEDALDGLESSLIANSATQCKHLVSRKRSLLTSYTQDLSSSDNELSALSDDSPTCSSRHPSELGRDSTSARGSDSSDAANAKKKCERRRVRRRHGLLLLLVLSLYVGRVEELCRFSEIPDENDVPSADADEIRDNVVAMWQFLLYESKILTESEQKEWIGIVSTFLGPPFDTPPLESII